MSDKEIIAKAGILKAIEGMGSRELESVVAWINERFSPEVLEFMASQERRRAQIVENNATMLARMERLPL